MAQVHQVGEHWWLLDRRKRTDVRRGGTDRYPFRGQEGWIWPTYLGMDYTTGCSANLPLVSAMLTLGGRTALLLDFEQCPVGMCTSGYAVPFDTRSTGKLLLVNQDHGGRMSVDAGYEASVGRLYVVIEVSEGRREGG
jgi:hypothetical protein